jgi:5'-3' exonuclease
MIEILSYYGIKPIFVFDGRTVELKKNTNLKRNEKKEFYKAKGQEFLNQGNVY